MINRQELVQGLAKIQVHVEQVKPADGEFPYPSILVQNQDLPKLEMLRLVVGQRKPHGLDMTWVQVYVHKMKWINVGK